MDDPIVPPEDLAAGDLEDEASNGDPPQGRRYSRDKLYVDGVEVNILAERAQYYNADGKLVTESFSAFSERNIRKLYATLEDFLTQWNAADRKSLILVELLQHGVLWDELQAEVGGGFDPFDLIYHAAFDRPTLTRSERACKAKAQAQALFDKYEASARQVLGALLDKYSNEGIEALERAVNAHKMTTFLQISPFNEIDRPIEIVRAFGGTRWIYCSSATIRATDLCSAVVHTSFSR